ncbi:hypothetical protein BV20DRAFT_982216 [Pilatotrama ljubarskyi]|nr:hypothetical protein BV20DRAFT_982216 [Pilatotrama ljubarskyi]
MSVPPNRRESQSDEPLVARATDPSWGLRPYNPWASEAPPSLGRTLPTQNESAIVDRSFAEWGSRVSHTSGSNQADEDAAMDYARTLSNPYGGGAEWFTMASTFPSAIDDSRRSVAAVHQGRDLPSARDLDSSYTYTEVSNTAPESSHRESDFIWDESNNDAKLDDDEEDDHGQRDEDYKDSTSINRNDGSQVDYDDQLHSGQHFDGGAQQRTRAHFEGRDYLEGRRAPLAVSDSAAHGQANGASSIYAGSVRAPFEYNPPINAIITILTTST